MRAFEDEGRLDRAILAADAAVTTASAEAAEGDDGPPLKPTLVAAVAAEPPQVTVAGASQFKEAAWVARDRKISPGSQ